MIDRPPDGLKLVKRDGKWHVKYKAVNGEWRRLSTELPISVPELDAMKVGAKKVRDALADGTTTLAPVQARAVGTMFNVGEALEHAYRKFWQGTRSDINLKFVIRAMEREIGHWLLAELSTQEGYRRISHYRDQVLAKEQGLAPQTCNHRMGYLKKALVEAHLQGHLAAVPIFPKGLKTNNKRRRYVSEEEETKFMPWLDAKVAAERIDPKGSESGRYGLSTYQWAYVRDLVAGLIDTGARVSELLTLKECDGKALILEGIGLSEEVSPQTKRRRTEATNKTGEPRYVPLTPRASEAILRLLKHPLHGNPSITPNWVGHRWDQCRAAFPEIADVNIHILRHTFASRILNAGYDLIVVKDLLGHTDIRTTQRYAHLAKRGGVFERAISALAKAPVGVPSAPREAATGTHGTHGTEPFHK